MENNVEITMFAPECCNMVFNGKRQALGDDFEELGKLENLWRFLESMHEYISETYQWHTDWNFCQNKENKTSLTKTWSDEPKDGLGYRASMKESDVITMLVDADKYEIDLYIGGKCCFYLNALSFNEVSVAFNDERFSFFDSNGEITHYGRLVRAITKALNDNKEEEENEETY